MDVAKILADLRQERDQLEEAILSLERLATGRGRRRGRPPAWMSEAKKRGRPLGSKNKPHAKPHEKAQPQEKTAAAAAAKKFRQKADRNVCLFNLLPPF